MANKERNAPQQPARDKGGANKEETMTVQITYRNLEGTAPIEAAIHEEAAKLTEFFQRITSCRVIVEAPHKHRESRERFHVRIDLVVPGEELVVSHEPHTHSVLKHAGETALHKSLEKGAEHKDLYVTIHDAFASARRQLKEYARKRRGEVKHHAGAEGIRAAKLEG